MKRNIKKAIIILVLILTVAVLPLTVYATGDLTPQPIQVEPGTDTTTDTYNNSIINSGVTENEETIVEDKIAEDKILPEAGFDRNMLYIISALVVFAVFAYIKVVKYNID